MDIGSAVSVFGPYITVIVFWTPTETGTHKIKVTVTDESGNDDSRETASFEVVEQPKPPVVESITVPSTVYRNESNILSAVVTDVNGDLDDIIFKYDGPSEGTTWEDIGSEMQISGSRATPEVTWTPTETGTHKIKVTVADEPGNSDSDETASFQVVDRPPTPPPPPPATVSLSRPDTVYQNEYNYLSVRITDPSGDLKEVQFQYDGPSAGTTWVDIGSVVPVTGGEDTAAVMWKPTQTGAHKIKVTVTDAVGNSQSVESANLTIMANTGTGNAGTASPRIVQGPFTVGDDQIYDVAHDSDIATSGLVTIEDGGQSIFWSGGRIVLGDGFSADPSGEGFFNAVIDSDMDGLSDLEERALGTDPNDPDTDGDGFSDPWENLFGFNPIVADDPSNWPDNDTDGMPDAWEDHYSGKSALDSFWEDYDGDGLLNYVEFWAGSDPGPAVNGDSIDFDTPGLWKPSDYLDSKFPSEGEVLLLLPEKGVYSMDEGNAASTLSLVTADL